MSASRRDIFLIMLRPMFILLTLPVILIDNDKVNQKVTLVSVLFGKV